jgi:hypothetical protein
MVRRLQAGAGPDLPSHSGNTPLHVACAAGARLPLLRLLTHARADVHARNCRDETPLHLLAMSAAFEAGVAVAHLLECGGRVGARDERGDTPLHRAVACGQLERACQLVSAGSSLVAPRHAATPPRCNPATLQPRHVLEPATPQPCNRATVQPYSPRTQPAAPTCAACSLRPPHVQPAACGPRAPQVMPNHAGHCALELVAWQGGARVAERLREAIATPPLWVPDGAVSSCMLCRAPFSARLRRVHHCRHCGAAVCAACSPHKLPIPKFGVAKPVRCCRACHAVLGAPTGDLALAASASPHSPSASARLALAPAGAPAAPHPQAAAPTPPLLSAAMLLGEGEAEAEAEAPRPTADTDTTGCSPDPSHPSSGRVSGGSFS